MFLTAIMLAGIALAADVKPVEKPVTVTKEQITARVAVLEIQREDTVGRLNAINGAIADYKYLLQTVEESAKPLPASAPKTAKAPPVVEAKE